MHKQHTHAVLAGGAGHDCRDEDIRIHGARCHSLIKTRGNPSCIKGGGCGGEVSHMPFVIHFLLPVTIHSPPSRLAAHARPIQSRYKVAGKDLPLHSNSIKSDRMGNVNVIDLQRRFRLQVPKSPAHRSYGP